MIWFLAYCLVGIIALLITAMYKSNRMDESDFLFFAALDVHCWILLPFWPVIVLCFLFKSDPEDPVPSPRPRERPAELDLVGKTGVTKSALRPTGHIQIDELEYEATAESNLIDPGINVRVVAQSGGVLRVCPFDLPDEKS